MSDPQLNLFEDFLPKQLKANGLSAQQAFEETCRECRVDPVFDATARIWMAVQRVFAN